MVGAGTQTIGLVCALAIALGTRSPFPAPPAAAWCLVAGVTGVAGLLAFYRGLAVGEMSLVAPIAAVVGAGVPVVAGFVFGDRLAPAQTAGIAAALVAVALVARPARGEATRGVGGLGEAARGVGGLGQAARGVGGLGQAARGEAARGRSGLDLALVAGIGFAGYFIAIDRAFVAGAGTWWPLPIARAASLGLILVAAVATGRGTGIRAAFTPIVALSGIADTGGNLGFLLARSQGPLGPAAVVSSLYPAVTVMLAWWLLRERLSRVHAAGIGLAFAGLVLIAGVG